MPQQITGRFLAVDNEGQEQTLYVLREYAVEDVDRRISGAQLIQNADGGNLNRKAKGLYVSVVGNRRFVSRDPNAP